MRKSIMLLLAMALPAFAGTTTSKAVIEPSPPPEIWTWFAGASAGYMFDQYDEPIYALHAGVDTPWSPLGWNVSFFLEVAYTEPDDSIEILDSFQTVPSNTDLEAELEIVPLTANIKFEHSFGNGLGVYFGGGVGVAFVSLDLHADFAVSPDFDSHDSDTVFAAQVFTGLVYNFNENAEVYTGLKWLYLDDTDNFPLEDDFIAELGFRWNF